MKKPNRDSKWEWYAVKNLYMSDIEGEPTKSKIDDNYSDAFKTYEEQIIIVKAQSYEHAYRLGERKAKEAEMEYYNPYDQLVKCRYVASIDCFRLFDDSMKSGTEVYSRLIHVPKGVKSDDIIKTYYPESLPTDNNSPDYYYPFRVREFNQATTPEE